MASSIQRATATTVVSTACQSIMLALPWMTTPIADTARLVIIAVRFNRRVEMQPHVAGLAQRTLFDGVEPFPLDQADEVAHERVARLCRDGRRRLRGAARVGQPVDELPGVLGRSLQI